jgi:hypothetical protein
MARWKKAPAPELSENAQAIEALTKKSKRWEADKAATLLLPADVGRFSRWLFESHPNPYALQIKALATPNTIQRRNKQ